MTHVIYYSWSGKTRHCAELAAGIIQCGITEIVEVVPRKRSLWGFLKSGYEASTEKTSEIKPLVTPEADTLVLAFPVWAGKIPPAVNTALRTLDVSGRKVVVINTMSAEDKTFPGIALAQDLLTRRGAAAVNFIAITTGRYPEEIWDATLQRKLAQVFEGR